jgi:hypothetical protein
MADVDPRDKPIECPYTGKTVHREHCMKTGLTYQRGAWSPNRVYKDEETASLQLRRRGREWLPDDAELRCAYTGAKITFEQVEGGVRPVGAFDPDRVYTNGSEFEYRMRMRNGKVPDGIEIDPTYGKASGIRVTYAEDVKPFELEQYERQQAAGEAATKVSSETFAEKTITKALKKPKKIQVVVP